MNGSVILITGPRASGKSTCADSLHAVVPASILLHIDDLFHTVIAQDRARWNGHEADLYAVVARHQLALARELAGSGVTVILDGTILPHQLTPLTDPPAVSLNIVALLPPLEECLANEHRPSRTVSAQEDRVRTTWREMQEWRNVHMPSVQCVDAPALRAGRLIDDLCRRLRGGY